LSLSLATITMSINAYALQNASICPSDEDSQTFYVNASNGDSFRLKGNVDMLCIKCCVIVQFVKYSSCKLELEVCLTSDT